MVKRAASSHLCWPVTKWPKPDQQPWDAAQCRTGQWGKRGRRARYRAISNRKVATGYGRWLAWLDSTKRLDPNQPPADRITPEAVAEYLDALAETNADATLLNRLQELREAAKIMDPARDWSWFGIFVIWIQDRQASCRAQRRLTVSARDLYRLGWRMMATAEAETTLLKAATRFRDGLIIAALAAHPLRRRNMAGLQLHEQLVRLAGQQLPGDDGEEGERWWINLTKDDTKNKKPIHSPWPKPLVPHLETYLATYRPALAGQRGRWAQPVGNALWVSRDGSPLSYERLYGCLVEHTLDAFGERVGPHRFRHAVATTIAIEDPENIDLAPQLLGNTEATMQFYYNLARTVDGARRFQSAILKLRDGTLVLPGGWGKEATGDTGNAADAPATGSTTAIPIPVAADWTEELQPRDLGDLTGQVFGRLAVVRRVGRSSRGRATWRVRCTGCVAEMTRPRDWLLTIRAPDTGCERCDELDRLKAEFLTGQTIGGGAVLAYIGLDRHDQHTWRVVCVCGAEAARATAHIRQTIRAGRIACRPCAQTREARAARRETVAPLRHVPTRKGRARVDMLGAVNGRLQVTGYAEPDPLTGQTMLLVTCEVCGPKDKPMQVGNFKRAARCMGCQGMRKDLTRRRFGQLEVLGFSHAENWKAHWQCRCDCGRTVALSTNALTQDHQQTCGQCRRGRRSGTAQGELPLAVGCTSRRMRD